MEPGRDWRKWLTAGELGEGSGAGACGCRGVGRGFLVVPRAMAAAGLAAGAAAEVIFAGEDEEGAIHIVVAALDEGLVRVGGGLRHGVPLPEGIVAGGAGARKAGRRADFDLVEDRAGEM